MAATAKWLDADTVEITTGTSVVVRKVRAADLDGFPQLRDGRPGRVSAEPQPKRRRKAKAKADA